MKCRTILLCGHRSFAAKGLSDLLESIGYQVTCFSRGKVEKSNNVVTGPVFQIDKNPFLANSYDCVINYILLVDCPVEDNEAYIESLLKMCEKKKVEHLIHISSISVYKANVSLINDSAKVENDPSRKGAYGSLKVAQDEYIKKHLPNGTKLSLVRPGFILGKGLVDPIVGTGFRVPWNKLLAIGNAKSHLPLISRELVNQSILKILSNIADNSPEVFVLTDSNLPTRKEYLDACCELLGCGMGTISLPTIVWLAAAAGGEIVLRLLGKGDIKPWQKIRAACTKQRFDSTLTRKRLGMNFSFDWRKTLYNSVDAQEVNFELPYSPPASLGCTRLKKITYLGFGRIVHQKHLPALRKIGFSGDIDVYDLVPPAEDKAENIRIINKTEIDSSDIFVVATPGPAHIEALELLRKKDGRILLEKPLCYTRSELNRWEAFNRDQTRIFVCHNYRFKNNVQAMLVHLSRYNPGKICNVSLTFQSPPVSNVSATWLRKERKTRTLLMDYSLHFLDLACMFGDGTWNVDNIRYELNAMGQTSLIDGHISCNNYSVSFLLRQGFIPRKANLIFTFQNYSVSLRFFPDTFAPHMARDNAWLHKMEALRLKHGTWEKIFDKLFSRDSDLSHVYVYGALCEKEGDPAKPISFNNLQSFYNLILKLSEAVYGG